MCWRLLPPRSLLIGCALFALVWTTHALSRNVTQFDSQWTVFTALSILHRGNTNLDEYLPRLQSRQFYDIECAWPDGRVAPAISATSCRGTHFYAFYPVAVPALAAPVVGILEIALKAAQPVLRPLWSRPPEGARRSFLQGDLAASSAIVEVLIASLIIAAATVVIFLLAREYLAQAPAVVIALVFAFATPAWSIASRGLWQHGPCMLMLAIALLIAVRAERNPALIRFAGIPLALAFVVRPPGLVPLAVFTAFVLLRHRRHFIAYLVWAAPVALLLVGYDVSVYHNPLAPYFHPRRTGGLSLQPSFLGALAANWISPGRGLLVYCPVFLLSIVGLFLRQGSVSRSRLRWVAAVAITAYWVVISLAQVWWGGHCFGPRYFSDVTPFFVFLLIPVFSRAASGRGFRTLALRGAIAVLVLLSFFIHYRGANEVACYQWNVDPVNIDDCPARVWDWRDPPFLRGLAPVSFRTASPAR